jgi:hypothetical protein
MRQAASLIAIEHANQRNVTIYTVDAAGLRVHSRQQAAGGTISAVGAELAAISSAPDAPTDGETVAQLPLTLDAPDPAGVVRQVSRLAIGGLPPGPYSLVLTITDGASTTIRSAPFVR